MVWIVKTSYPDGIDIRIGYYDNAELTLIYDAKTGDLLSAHVTGDYKGKGR